MRLCSSVSKYPALDPGIIAINLGRTAAAEIYSAIERTPVIDGTDEFKGEKLRDSYDGSISLKNVVFAYPSRPQDVIFSNFDLKIESGQSLALVGPSGSGKSSLSKLLLRLYDPIGGKIVVGGIPLTELNLKYWRQQIGYVCQEPSLFPGSIRDNIAAGKLEGVATDEEVEAAARAASAHDFIMDLPDQYNSFYSGSSIQLSGGQIQRISIARALIRNPKILLLGKKFILLVDTSSCESMRVFLLLSHPHSILSDEATSALDTASERSVQSALEKVRSERKLTTITVAHRLSTIVNSDKIVVIAEGSIQESGTHRELLELGGIYAGLCEGQGLTADAGDQKGTIEEESTSMGAESKDGVEKAVTDTDAVDVEKGIVTSDAEEIADTVASPNLAGVGSRLRQYSNADILYSIAGYAGSIICGGLPCGEAILFGLITGNFFTIDNAEEMRSVNYQLSLWFFLLAGLSFIGNVCMGVGFGVSGCRLTRRMRCLVFEKIMRYPMSWFDYPEHSTGELTTALEEDSETVGNVTGLSQGSRIQVFSCLAAGMIVALAYSWQVGLTAIACVPLILGSGIIQAKFASKEAPCDHLVSPATLLERSFADIIVLQAYGLQEDVSSEYSKLLVTDVAFKKKQAGWSGLAYGLSQFAVFGTFSLVFYVGE